ncbi:uncharacterized protein DUF58 [Natranaerovirga hydrolytica]|uniref:Uncharacterized protein DUF58 n=1 Tax=Natranaerovirga hydrolytica TaxID=680378 RepID=A0A4R1MZI8_9FIRM|nr:DUF58 domain-containing protein [Natranaerovirga hydrolytica]TCK98696.1 uncharacterized protein DUF58 [Natranaerovirga hydrolytica]
MEEKIFDQDFFAKLNKLNFLVKMSLSQGANGGRKSTAKGTSVEFSDYREYIQGDDFRRIDWNAYGRFEKLFIKLFMEEREAVFNIFLDCSKSMDFGEEKKSKKALQLSAALSYIVLNNMDKLQLHTLQDNRIHTLQGISGKASFQKLLQGLTKVDFKGQTHLVDTIKQKNLKQRGVSIIISDFFTKEKIEEMVQYLGYKKQEIILIHLLSREEVAPYFEKMVNLIDSETQEALKLTITPKVIKTYQETLTAFCQEIEEKVVKYNGAYVKVVSDESLEKILLKSFSAKGFINKV